MSPQPPNPEAETRPLLLRALNCEPVHRPPIWVMRQAGRYLPEYRKIRAGVKNFMDMCKNPSLCCELALQPLQRYSLDAAIVFSDILTVPDALGLGVGFVQGEGPRLERRIEDERDLKQLPPLDLDRLDYVFEAVRLTRAEVDGKVPLIGFSGSPWTLATYMVEGGSSADFAQIKRMLYRAPQVLEALVEHLGIAVREYLQAQVAAGAQVVQIFDTWGGILPHHHWLKLSLEPARTAAQNLGVPVIFYTKGGGLWLNDMRDAGFCALGLDWTCDLAVARKTLGAGVALQGNLDPDALMGGETQLRNEVERILRAHPGPGHIFNLGHGIRPSADPQALQIVIDTIHDSAQSL